MFIALSSRAFISDNKRKIQNPKNEKVSPLNLTPSLSEPRILEVSIAKRARRKEDHTQVFSWLASIELESRGHFEWLKFFSYLPARAG